MEGEREGKREREGERGEKMKREREREKERIGSRPKKRSYYSIAFRRILRSFIHSPDNLIPAFFIVYDATFRLSSGV